MEVQPPDHRNVLFNPMFPVPCLINQAGKLLNDLLACLLALG